MAKMDKKWVILCSTAVAAVYATGYFSTEAQAIKMNSQPVQVSIQTKVDKPNMNAPINNEVNKPTASSAAKNTQPKQMYKDGTFTGTGMNRRGEIDVAVTIKKDKIIDVQITNWGMHYSESDVVALPSEVIQRQSINVDNVSGATFSTQAFANAVQDALNQAQNS